MNLFYFLIITFILEIYTVTHVITIPISFLNRLDGQIVSTFFNLNHSDASSWKMYASNFASDHGLNSSAMIETVQKKLEDLKYPDEILSHTNLFQNFTFTSQDASNLLLENPHIFSKKSEEKITEDLTTKLYFYASKKAADYFQSNIYVDLKLLLPEDIDLNHSTYLDTKFSLKNQESNIPAFVRLKHKIVIYQSLNADTGGTVALEKLYQVLSGLGFNTLLCNQSNIESSLCRNLSSDSIAVTGEWCEGVLDSYGAKHSGRGIRYHLGFHHHDTTTCKGHISVTDSQYLNNLLGNKVLGGYYLGCPMLDKLYDEFISSVRKPNHHIHIYDDKDEDKESAVVKKENLILFDPDYMNNYPSLNEIYIDIPPGWKLLRAENIPKNLMPLVLKRSKIIVDLSLPGPERLAGEGVLMGAIPVISSRWNGMSQVDFPGVFRMDQFNSSNISDTLLCISNNYERLLSESSTASFLKYMVSLPRRMAHTTDVIFSSSFLHFVLFAGDTVEEEILSNFQILSILYLFPLASIDIYVNDPMWFIRQHYSFVVLLHEAGYLSFDPLNPHSFRLPTKLSHVNFISKTEIPILHSRLLMQSSPVNNDFNSEKDSFTPWKGLIIFISGNLAFKNPMGLLQIIKILKEDEIYVFENNTAVILNFYLPISENELAFIIDIAAKKSFHIPEEISSPISNNFPFVSITDLLRKEIDSFEGDLVSFVKTSSAWNYLIYNIEELVGLNTIFEI